MGRHGGRGLAGVHLIHTNTVTGTGTALPETQPGSSPGSGRLSLAVAAAATEPVFYTGIYHRRSSSQMNTAAANSSRHMHTGTGVHCVDAYVYFMDAENV